MNKKHTRNLFAFALISFLSLSAMDIDEGGRAKRFLEKMDLEEGYGKKSTNEVSPTGPIICFNGQEISIKDIRYADYSWLRDSETLKINQKIQSEKYSALTPLMLGCLEDNPDFVVLCLECNALVNVGDNAGRTALMHATGIKGTFIPYIVQKLLANGADPTLHDRFGNTALSIAENTAKWINSNDPYDKSQEVVDLLKNVPPTPQQP